MTDDYEPPFVPRHGRVDDRRPATRDEIEQMRAILRSAPRPITTTPKTENLTDAQSAAIARKRLDEEAARRKP